MIAEKIIKESDEDTVKNRKNLQKIKVKSKMKKDRLIEPKRHLSAIQEEEIIPD